MIMSFYVRTVAVCVFVFQVSAFEDAGAQETQDMGVLDFTESTSPLIHLGSSPVKTEIISHQELLKHHASDLSDALRYVPGLQLREIHGKTGTGIWMQGYDADRVLVLIDGSPTSPSSGTAVDITQIAIGDVERIEIIRGAVSALYGASAMGGVVNIITREPVASQSSSIELSAGGWGSQNLNSDPLAKKHGKLNWSTKGQSGYLQLLADARLSEGFKATDIGDATQGWKGKKVNLSAKLSVDFGEKTNLKIMPRLFDEDASTKVDNFVPGVGNLPMEKIDNTRRYHLTSLLTYNRNPDSQLSFRVMFEDFENSALQDVIATPNLLEKKRLTKQDLGGVEFRVEQMLSNSHVVTAGIEVELAKMDVSLATNEEVKVAEVEGEETRSHQIFVQDSWLVSENLELLPGLRVHNNSGFGNYYSPMLSLMYSDYDAVSGELTYRAGVGNGYRTPSLKEQHYIFDHSHLGYQVIGTPDLEPESSISYQVGLEWVGDNGSVLELSAYRNDSKDLIDTSLDAVASADSGLAIYNYQNFSKTRAVGVEGSYRKRWSSVLSSSLSYAYLSAKDLSTGLKLVKRPEHELKLGLDIQMTDTTDMIFRINTETKQYLDEENMKTSPGFTTVDIKFNHAFGTNWKLFGGVNNLTGKQRDFSGEDFRPVEGRYVYAGFRFNTDTP